MNETYWIILLLIPSIPIIAVFDWLVFSKVFHKCPFCKKVITKWYYYIVPSFVEIMLFLVGIGVGLVITATLVNANFTISPTEIVKTVPTLSFGFLDPITITNQVNESMIVNISYSGNTQFIQVINSTTIQGNFSQQLYLPYFVPFITPSGDYYTYLSFSYNQTLKNMTIRLSVFDGITPEIRSCEVSPISINRTKNVTFNCVVTDNLNVSTVKAVIKGVNFTQEIVLNNLKKDEYSAVYTNNVSGIYNVTIAATDTSNNSAILDNLQFALVDWSPLSVFNADFLKVKYNQPHEKAIATLSDPANLKIKLNKFGYMKNMTGNLSVGVRLPDGRISVLGSEFVSFTDVPKGDVIIVIISDIMGDVKGEVVFSIDKEYASMITANFTWYTVPPVIRTTWYDNPVYCYSNDTGEYGTSKRKCEVTFSIDANIGDTMAFVPISIASINITRLTENEKILTSRVSAYKTLVYVLSIVSFLAVGGGVGYYIKENW